MPSSFTTKHGVKLLISRVHRAAIDKFLAAHPEPEPPSRKVEIWGGLEEDVPDYENEDYLRLIHQHRLLLGQDQLELIVPAIKVVDVPEPPDAELLQLLGVSKLDAIALLRYSILTDLQDLDQVVALVLYLSTVTSRGIQEAQQAMDVKWMDRPVLGWKVPAMPADYSSVFRDRRAAQFCGYSWTSFCELTGPEQSENVAFYVISQTLEYLSSNWRK